MVLSEAQWAVMAQVSNGRPPRLIPKRTLDSLVKKGLVSLSGGGNPTLTPEGVRLQSARDDASWRRFCS